MGGEANGQPAVLNGALEAANHEKVQPRVFRRRWAILVMFILLSASNGAQWIEYAIIAPTITHFYGVSYAAVDWTSMIYMLTYIPLVLPSSWILDRFGLRISVLLGAGGNALGAWIKILSTSPDAFWITFIGQTIVGASQMFTLGIPPRLAAVWFGPDQVSSACAAGVFGNQLGIAVGFVLPPLMVHNGTMEEIAYDLNVLFLCSAVLNSVVFVLILCFFSTRPPVPPSLAQLTALEASTGDSHFSKSLLKLLTSRDFMLLFLTYGINVGVFYAVSTLLSQMVLEYYPDASETVGTIGLMIIVAGMLGSLVCGIILDKTHAYKMTTLMLYLFSFVGMISFTFTLDLGMIWIVFLNAFLLGFFMTGYLPIGFEFAAEITFPTAESTSSGLLNASAQIFGILLTLAMGHLMHGVSIFASNLCMSLILVVGAVMTAIIREDCRRQRALKAPSNLPTSETQLTTVLGLTEAD